MSDVGRIESILSSADARARAEALRVNKRNPRDSHHHPDQQQPEEDLEVAAGDPGVYDDHGRREASSADAVLHDSESNQSHFDRLV
jgi:hypothetical protein